MATIETRKALDGTVTYRARVRVLGHPERTASFDRKTDASTWAKSVETDLKRGKYVPTSEAHKRTVAQMIERYIGETLPYKSRNTDRKNVERRLNWWKEQIGDYAIAHITADIITDCKQRLIAAPTPRGHKRSASNINHNLVDLSAVFKTAIKEWHWIDRNPVAGVGKMEEPQGRVRFLDEGERTRLLEACMKVDPNLHDLVVLAISTGARKGELQNLVWRDVDLARCSITLHITKNRERRALPLAGMALDIMRERRKVRRIDTDLVFPATVKRGATLNIRQTWYEALHIAKLENFKFHDLRHTAASYLAMSGATTAELAAILGHKTLAMVKRYAHLSDSHVAGVVERMNKKMLGDGS